MRCGSRARDFNGPITIYPVEQTFKFATWRFVKKSLSVTVATRPDQSHDNDAVVSVEVFEHLPDLLMALRAIHRTLRPRRYVDLHRKFWQNRTPPVAFGAYGHPGSLPQRVGAGRRFRTRTSLRSRGLPLPHRQNDGRASLVRSPARGSADLRSRGAKSPQQVAESLGRTKHHCSDSQSMKIAVASAFLGHVLRGVEAWAQDLAAELHRRGMDVTLFQWRRRQATFLTRDTSVFALTIPTHSGNTSPASLDTDCGAMAIRAAAALAAGGIRAPGSPGNCAAENSTSFIRRIPRNGADPRKDAAKGASTPQKVILANGTEEPLEFLLQFEHVQELGAVLFGKMTARKVCRRIASGFQSVTL